MQGAAEVCWSPRGATAAEGGWAVLSEAVTDVTQPHTLPSLHQMTDEAAWGSHSLGRRVTAEPWCYLHSETEPDAFSLLGPQRVEKGASFTVSK